MLFEDSHIFIKPHLIIMLLLFGSIKKINEMGSFDNALVYYGEFNSNILFINGFFLNIFNVNFSVK